MSRGWLGSVREAERRLPDGEWCWPSPGGARPICLPGLERVGVDGAAEGGPRELPAAGLRTLDFTVQLSPWNAPELLVSSFSFFLRFILFI